jgi:hypothetical protein
MTFYPDGHPAFDMPEFNPELPDEPDSQPEGGSVRHVKADAVRFEGDEDGWHMLIDTDEELIDVHIHGIAWELFQNCDRTIGSEYRYAMSIKQEVATARTLDEDDPDQGYDRNDPKHPAYHSTHVAIWDEREGK